MVSEMESINNTNKSLSNSSYQMANSNPQIQQHSPQSVGVEFVRQYYTMLNRAPQLLFRFYSDDSVFIHDVVDKHNEPKHYIRGQKLIGSYIESLNFKNCHTKIRQVDSMETLGNGVVIQVIGELSNNGQPLRRFLQTFVLTPQTPNKYYVRNDIFRYPDGPEFGEENEHEEYQHEKIDVDSKIETNVEEDDYPPVESSEKDYSYPSNGSSSNVNVEDTSNVEESVNQEETELVQEDTVEQANTSLTDVAEVKEPLDDGDSHHSVVDSVTESVITTGHFLNEPKTYASMLSKGFQSGTTTAAASVSPSAPAAVPKPVLSVPLVNNNDLGNIAVENQASVANSNVNRGARNLMQRDRFIKKPGFNNSNRRNESRESAKNNDSDSGENENSHFQQIPKKQFPDENQLFVGNLLPDFCEEDLTNIFRRYGKILEVRIHRQSHKANSNKANRNYGFITFENPEIVDQIIAQKPILHGHHRYNVEKKQGKSNYDRNNARNNPNSSPRNGNQSGFPNPSLRHMPVNVSGGGGGSGQGNSGDRQRNRQNYNSSNNAGNRNYSGGSNFSNNRNNTFNQQPQQNRP